MNFDFWDFYINDIWEIGYGKNGIREIDLPENGIWGIELRDTGFLKIKFRILVGNPKNILVARKILVTQLVASLN